MWLGVDYYPEQWDERLMETDMDNIKELGGNVIRIGEFSWHLMETQDGKFDFSFFDRVVDRAKQKNLKVIMGTPTATVPAWLVKLHPDILSEFEGGKKRSFGGRHVYCFNNRNMYYYSERIIRRLVEHYRDEPQIIAWQIDNEIGHEGSDVCFCDNCKTAFRSFLHDKFNGNIDELNHVYGTAFWSQEYNSFDEIPTPAETITTHNPALRLDWERFWNKSINNFIEFQAKLIKTIAPNAVVMHDFPGGGLSKHVDYSQTAELLDVVAYNNYPVWGGQKEPLKPYEIGFALDYIRGLKGENFWITEAIMGAQGHDITGFLPRPNQAKLWSYQGVAHGCNSMMYFRYRGAVKGAEQFCYGVIDADNRKRRKFYEVQNFFSDISKYAQALNTPIKSEVAIIYDYDSLASFRIQRQSILLDPVAEMQKLYKVFHDRNISVDIIPSRRGFSDYKILIVPNILITDCELAERFKSFVHNGGRLIVTYRTAVKNRDNNLVFGEMLPIGLNELCGVTVEETESLQELNAFPLSGLNGASGFGGIFREMLVPSTAKTLYSYGDEFYSQYSAVTENSFGNGKAYYIGCSPDTDTLDSVVGSVIGDIGLETIVSPNGVEVIKRGEGKNKIKMIMNHNSFSVDIEGFTLAPFECKITE